jgi:hypothetical protein
MRITSQSTAVAGMLLALGLLMVGLPAGLIAAFSADGPVPPGVWALAALVGLPGALIVWFSGRRLVQRVRFGAWSLECPDEGGRLGQPLEATLLPPRVVHPSGEVQCRLVCLHTTGVRSSSPAAGSARASARLVDVPWSLPPVSLDPHSGLRLSLPLPASGLASSRSRTASVEWKLSVTVPVDGATHELEFEIPVRAGAGGLSP